VLLVGVAALGIAGGISPAARVVPSPSSPAVAALVVVVAPVGVAPAADPSAAARAPLGVPFRHTREEGTDGLMGGIPFGLPADTPLVRLDRVNRFTIDDAALGWSRGSSFPTRVHRIGGLPSYATDPRAR
jgi:hypothetical protein